MKKKFLKQLLIIIAAVNLAAIVVCLIRDYTDPYYFAQMHHIELSEEALLAQCPDLPLSEEEQLLLQAILNDSAVCAAMPMESGEPYHLSEEDCARLICQYEGRPSDICRISVSTSTPLSFTANYSSTIYINVDFYETEREKGDSPYYSYPCLSLDLCVTKREAYQDKNSALRWDESILYSYDKHIYHYSKIISPNRQTASIASWPSCAAYEEYNWERDVSGNVRFEKWERTLTPVKYEHLKMFYLGWFYILMSV